jgi:hypothetical protein
MSRVARLKLWWKDLTINQRAAGLLAVLLIVTLVRSEIRVSDAVRKAQQAGTEVQRLLANQTANRAGNVKVWCDHFVKLEAALTAYVASVEKAPVLVLTEQLTPKQCIKLEHATTKSTTTAAAK